MATCLVCSEQATVALHAISQEFPDKEAPGGQFHYTELVFACDQHKGQSDALTAKLPEPERFAWTLQADETPITVCPQCKRKRHASHIWTCPECGRTGCSGCMMRYPVTGTCGDDLAHVDENGIAALAAKHGGTG